MKILSSALVIKKQFLVSVYISMFKGSFLNILLSVLFISSLAIDNSKASVWSKIKECITNPCNCGNSYHEEWQEDGLTLKELTNGTIDLDSSTNGGITVPTLSDWSYRNNYKNGLCPPYNRRSGRSGCLRQFRAPSSDKFSSYPANSYNFNIYCAEASRSRSSTSIVVRMQSCNALSCFTQKKELNGKRGQCVTFASAYGAPQTRFCARVAVPRLIEDNSGGITLEPDPGLYFHFLDRNGFPRPDPGIKFADEVNEYINENQTSSASSTSSEKQDLFKYRAFLPRICLYEDPSLYEGLTAWMEPWYRNTTVDLYDTHPYTMPYHNSGPGSNDSVVGTVDFLTGNFLKNDVVQDEFFFKKNGFDSLFYPGSLGARSITSFDENASSNVKILSKSVDLRWYDDNDNYKNWVKDFVYSKKYSLGCAYLPIGEYPYPFCPQTPEFPPTVSMQEICPAEIYYDDALGKEALRLKQSTISSPCVNSSPSNNFIKNSVRLSLDKNIYLCQDGDDALFDNGKCVRFGSNLTPSLIHASYNDQISICPSSIEEGSVCAEYINSSYPAGTNVRVIYGYQDGSNSSVAITYGYPTDAKGICDGITFPCVLLYGINLGEYSDISFDLSELSSSEISDGYLAGQTASLTDRTSTGSSVNYNVSTYISFMGEDDTVDTDSITLESNSMCATYNTGSGGGGMEEDLGCIKRATPPKITINKCDSSCANNTYLTPKLQVTLDYSDLPLGEGISSSIEDSATFVFGTNDLSVGPSGDGQNPYFNAIGASVTTIATDEKYIYPPFYGSYAVQQGGLSIFGEYIDTNPPFNSDGTLKSDTKYLSGIEYEIGSYLRGAKMISAMIMPQTQCHSNIPGTNKFDDRNCILTTKNYHKNVDCSEFLALNVKVMCSYINQDDCVTHATISPIAIKDDNGNLTGEYVNFKTCNSEDGTTDCYVLPSSMTKNLCVASNDALDRIEPLYYTGASIKVNSFYDATSLKMTTGPCATTDTDKNFNEKNCATRDKTIYELSGVVDTSEPPKCSSESASETSGYASWTEVALGEESVGTCASGYAVPSGQASLANRKCYMDENGSVMLETITSSSTCVYASNYCSAVTSANSSSGYATWTSVAVGSESKGTCKKDYYPPTDVLATRTCNFNQMAQLTLDSITTETTCIQGCSENTSFDEANGYAYWPAAQRDSESKVEAYGSLSSGCASGYIPYYPEYPNIYRHPHFYKSRTRNCSYISSSNSTVLSDPAPNVCRKNDAESIAADLYRCYHDNYNETAEPNESDPIESGALDKAVCYYLNIVYKQLTGKSYEYNP
ncbi:MAG: hypothetical protein SFT93_01030 [Rickettsiaceae bacterium]|nr:hypothetical protein [Rickettsiaceae bacterium]